MWIALGGFDGFRRRIDRVMTTRSDADYPRFAWRGVLLVSLLAAAALGAVSAKYGFFGDELYFLAAGRRLTFEYADQGPLAPFIAHLSDLIDPGSAFAVRIPTLAMMVAVAVLAACCAREFRAGPRYQMLAAAGYATSLLAFDHGQLTTFAFDVALQSLIIWLLVRWVRTRQDWLLIAAGLAAAVDAQVKWTIPALWAFLGLGVLAVGPRDLLRKPALWLGSAMLAASMAPGVVWQARHGWPEFAMTKVIAQEQYSAGTGPLVCLVQICLQVGLLGAGLCVLGLWGVARRDLLRPYRFLLVAGLGLLASVLIENGRSYYVAGSLPVLMGAGAAVLAEIEAPGRTWVRRLFTGLAVVSTVAFIAAMAVLPLPIRWIRDPVTDQRQYGYRVMLFGEEGFGEMTAAVRDALRGLPDAERRDAVVVTASYVQAGALEEYGRQDGLPAVYSPNRGFGYFAPPPDSARTVVYLGVDRVNDHAFRAQFAQSVAVAHLDNPLGLPGLDRLVTVWVCRTPLHHWAQVWPTLRTLAFPEGI
jgi:hypothetical protein